MLYQYIRIFFSNNGTLTDYSLQNQEEAATVPLEMVSAEDWIYVGQHYPFNNFFIQIDTANAVSSTMSIQYWGGKSQEWVDALDILDNTSVSGATLARSGIIQFTPDVDHIWHGVADTKNEPQPLGLETLNIYNVHWMRFKASADTTAGSAAKRIAYAFTQNQQLDNIDVTINQFLTSFASGKTNWDDEIITASMQLVSDLRRKGLIVSPGQILRFDDVSLAADLKTLMLIYKNLGPGYQAKLEMTARDYENALSLTRFSFDTNEDAFLSKGELYNSIAKLVR